MLTTMIIVFLIGYLLIALEHPLKINKAGTALLTGTILWVLYTFGAPQFIPTASAEEFKLFLDAFPFIKDLPYADQCIRFVIDHQILDSIGEIAETLIFLIGAMITVELFSRRVYVHHQPHHHQQQAEVIVRHCYDHLFHVGSPG